MKDLLLLANHFLREFTMAYGRRPKELTPEAYAVLQEHRWPGNVRELRNLMERIVIMNPQLRVDARHIPLTNGKRNAMERTVDETKGNVTKTAELLGLSEDEDVGYRAQGVILAQFR